MAAKKESPTLSEIGRGPSTAFEKSVLPGVLTTVYEALVALTPVYQERVLQSARTMLGLDEDDEDDEFNEDE